MEPLSADVIERCFDAFYPNGKRILIAGAENCLPHMLHDCLNLGQYDLIETAGLEFRQTTTHGVTVASVILPPTLSTEQGQAFRDYHGLLYLIHGTQLEDNIITAAKENMRLISLAAEDYPFYPVAVGVVKAPPINRATFFEHIQTVLGLNSSVVPHSVFRATHNNLVLMKIFDYIGDHLWLFSDEVKNMGEDEKVKKKKARKHLRRKWKIERDEARAEWELRKDERKDQRDIQRVKREKKLEDDMLYFNTQMQEMGDEDSLEEPYAEYESEDSSDKSIATEPKLTSSGESL